MSKEKSEKKFFDSLPQQLLNKILLEFDFNTLLAVSQVNFK